MPSIEQIRPEHTWRLRREVLYPDEPLAAMKMDEDDHGYHFATFEDNALVAVVSLFQKGDDWQFRKFAVAAGVQRKGIGRALLNYIIGFVENENGKRIWCNARLSATGFYAKFGFTEAGKVFHKNGFDYIIMEKTIAIN